MTRQSSIMSTPERRPAPYGGGRQQQTPVSGCAPITCARWKKRGERVSMLTGLQQYARGDVRRAGVEVLLVGDSASNDVFAKRGSLP